MTPAVNAVKQAGIEFRVHEYEHDPKAEFYGKEAASKLDIDMNRVFKTLVVQAERQGLVVAVVPVSGQLDLKRLAKLFGVKKVHMADKHEVERVTGYVIGGVSPLGQKRSLPTVIDASAQDFDTIFVSAGRRGLEIELLAMDLSSLTQGTFETISR